MNCPECKRLFQESRWTQRYCSDACSQRARRKRKKIINQEYQERLKAQQSIFCRKDVVIVSDPLPPDEGGFSRGAVISSSSLVMMLHLGTCTPGMVIQHSGVTERVVGELNYPQDLEEL